MDASVLVLEAGGRDHMPLYKIPLMAGILFRINITIAVPNGARGLHDRQLRWPGQVLGGSNQLNGMVYTRAPSRLRHLAANGQRWLGL